MAICQISTSKPSPAPVLTVSPAAPSGLPQPPAEAVAHSRRLLREITALIEARHGPIPFSDYMDLCLYAPGLGYYSAGASKFGEAGDFVTAPELGPLFGRCLARQCGQILARLDGGDILELGAGSGRLAVDLLLALEAAGSLPGRYRILETSADLRQRQQQCIEGLIPHLGGRVDWLDRPPAAFRGVILANEVLDALPVDCFRIHDGQVLARKVALEEGRLCWQSEPEPDRELARQVRALAGRAGIHLAEGYAGEFSPRLRGWLEQITAGLDSGVLLLIDYGGSRAEVWHPGRVDGSLRCYYRHRLHDDPFFLPGLQDLTSDVDFTAVAEAGETLGLALEGYVTQAHGLINLGIEEILQAGMREDPDAALRWAGQARRLMLPGEMGERFKMMALGRGIDIDLIGFREFDRRHAL